MQDKWLQGAAFLLGVLSVQASWAAEEFTCKGSLQLAAASVVPQDIPADYHVVVPKTTVRLTGISVFDGPPEEGAALKPASWTAGGDRIKWVFEGTYEKGKWFSCDYANGIVRLSRKIGEPSSACTAAVTKHKPPAGIQAKLTCQ
jgi:hypothetical protein